MARHAVFFGLLAGGLFVGNVLAAENMKLYGTLIEPPLCTISNGGAVEVNFGERVGVKKVDGNNYRQPVNYPVNCKEGRAGICGCRWWARTLIMTPLR